MPELQLVLLQAQVPSQGLSSWEDICSLPGQPTAA